GHRSTNDERRQTETVKLEPADRSDDGLDAATRYATGRMLGLAMAFGCNEPGVASDILVSGGDKWSRSRVRKLAAVRSPRGKATGNSLGRAT
ncbi:MAG TPA: hypothetical protein VL769_00160, partial [Acidimicrobiia bacterium]|nr:hypothetical protein [Acidimicrobiia bacterium]